jgi:FtsP/CotA-like multicopper oxidase with cupredoxin domain
MKSNRRGFLGGGMAAAIGFLGGAGESASGAALGSTRLHGAGAAGPGAGAGLEAPGAGDRAAAGSETTTGAAVPAGIDAPLPVQTPDVPKLEYELDGDVKVFRLRAEVVRREFVPGRSFDVWGYNGSCPGPTIEVNQGDRVRVIVENRLPEATSMHWHGFEIPIEMDGIPGVVQDPIPPGGTYTYEFTLHQHGTFFYHSHMPMQEMMGMIGLFIMHPREAHSPAVDQDFGLILQEWSLLATNSVPDSMSMEFNWLTINGRAGPHTTPLIVRLGDRVRIRMVNLGMDHHPMHLHGNTFHVTATEAGRVPEAAWTPENTVLVGVAQARDIEFDARYPGDWMLHCHLPHHMMNQMVPMVGPSPAHQAHGGAEMPMPMEGMQHRPSDGPLVPGYPQDMFMAMDEMVAKPETHGLRPTWSAGVMGMMTLVRVLPDELYEEIRRLQAEAAGTGGAR